MGDQDAMKPTGAEQEGRAFILAVLAVVLTACALNAELTCAQFGAMTPSQQLQALSDDLRQELSALKPDIDFDPAEIADAAQYTAAVTADACAEYPDITVDEATAKVIGY